MRPFERSRSSMPPGASPLKGLTSQNLEEAIIERELARKPGPEELMRDVEDEGMPPLEIVVGCVTISGRSMETDLELSDPNEPRVNQDAYCALPNGFASSRGGFLAVFDGHGPVGHLVSRYCKDRIPARLIADGHSRATLMENPRRALEAAFRGVNAELNSIDGLDVEYSGTTAVALHIYGRLITCGWVGDSRAVLGRENLETGRIEAVALTCDHKPELPAERRRIEAMDGRVARLMRRADENGSFRGGPNSPGVGEHGEGPFRVWMKNLWVPGLSMSRSLGDSIAHRVGVTPEPEIRTHEVVENDRFIVVATDGIWEFVSNEEAVAIVAACDAPEEAATTLAREAFKRWKQRNDGEIIDDITVLVATLRNIESRAGSSRRSSMDRGSRRSSMERLSQGSGSSLGSQRSSKRVSFSSEPGRL